MTFSVRIKASTTLASVTAVLLLSLGLPCAHAQTAEPAKFTSAQIASTTVLLVDDDAPDEKRLTDKSALESRAPTIIKKALQEEGLRIAEEGAPASTPGLATIRTTIKYNPGNQALRWVGGMFGAGKGTIDIKMEAIDPATEKVVATVNVKDTKRMGATGGNFYSFADSTLEGAAADLADELSKIK